MERKIPGEISQTARHVRQRPGWRNTLHDKLRRGQKDRAITDAEATVLRDQCQGSVLAYLIRNFGFNPEETASEARGRKVHCANDGQHRPKATFSLGDAIPESLRNQIVG